MYKLRVLMVLFFVFLIFTLIFSGYPYIAASTVAIATLIAAIGLLHFVSEIKIKKIGKIKIEEVTFIRNFVFRSYIKVKDVWVVYDKKEKKFRVADFRDLPIKGGLTIFFGLLFLYISYLILSNLTQFPEFLLFRAAALIIFLTMGVYSFFVGLGRISSLGTENSKKICRILNGNKSLKNIIQKEKTHFEITPNFLLWNGFVTSIEFIFHEKIGTKTIEKVLVQISKIVEKIK